jgi:hypothetical protein
MPDPLFTYHERAARSYVARCLRSHAAGADIRSPDLPTEMTEWPPAADVTRMDAEELWTAESLVEYAQGRAVSPITGPALVTLLTFAGEFTWQVRLPGCSFALADPVLADLPLLTAGAKGAKAALVILESAVDAGNELLGEAISHGLMLPPAGQCDICHHPGHLLGVLAADPTIRVCADCHADPRLPTAPAAVIAAEGPPRAEPAGIWLSRGQLEAWSGMRFTADDLTQLADCLPGSSVPEAIATIVHEAVLGIEPEEEDPPVEDFDPGPEVDDEGGMSEYRHQEPDDGQLPETEQLRRAVHKAVLDTLDGWPRTSTGQPGWRGSTPVAVADRVTLYALTLITPPVTAMLLAAEAAAADETEQDLSPLRRRCPDCGVSPGERHTGGCDTARCLRTGGQRIACRHRHGHGRDVWTGRYPGEEDATRFGWFTCRDYGNGGWRRCPPGYPGARPDLNRLYMEATWDPAIPGWRQPGKGTRHA